MCVVGWVDFPPPPPPRPERYDVRKERPVLGDYLERVREATRPHYDEVRAAATSNPGQHTAHGNLDMPHGSNMGHLLEKCVG